MFLSLARMQEAPSRGNYQIMIHSTFVYFELQYVFIFRLLLMAFSWEFHPLVKKLTSEVAYDLKFELSGLISLCSHASLGSRLGMNPRSSKSLFKSLQDLSTQKTYAKLFKNLFLAFNGYITYTHVHQHSSWNMLKTSKKKYIINLKIWLLNCSFSLPRWCSL